MKVKDIMTSDVITLSPDMLVKDASKKLFELQISGLPVVDNDENHVGGTMLGNPIGILIGMRAGLTFESFIR